MSRIRALLLTLLMLVSATGGVVGAAPAGAPAAAEESAIDRPVEDAARSTVGSVLLVDDDGAQCPGASYTSIQTAVANATAGDTVRVCAGQYTEQVTIGKRLTLEANNRARTTPGATGNAVLSGADELAVGVSIEHSNVVVDGLEITSYREAGIRTPPGPARVNNVDVRHNYVHDVGTSRARAEHGLIVDGGSGSERAGWVVANNTFEDTDSYGVLFSVGGTAEGLFIRDNALIQTGANTAGMESIVVFASSGQASAIEIVDNDIDTNSGIRLANLRGSLLANAEIRGNEIETNIEGVFLNPYCGAGVSNCSATLRDVFIRNNEVSTNDDGIRMDARNFQASATLRNVEIIGNVISARDSAVNLSRNTSHKTVEVHRNDLLDARWGVRNDDRAMVSNFDVVNATNNYWGAPDGPSSRAPPGVTFPSPYADPLSTAVANGSGTAVSPGVQLRAIGTVTNFSNVHFAPYSSSAVAGADREPDDGDGDGANVSRIGFDYGRYGGNLNIEVNGDQLFNISQFDAPPPNGIDGATLGGATINVTSRAVPGGRQGHVEITGDIRQFRVGGQEFWIDNVEFGPRSAPSANVTFTTLSPSQPRYAIADTFTSDGVEITPEEFIFADGSTFRDGVGQQDASPPAESGGTAPDFNTRNINLAFNVTSAAAGDGGAPTFDVSNVSAPSSVGTNDRFTFSADVTNTGSSRATVTVEGSYATALVGTRTLTLDPGETRTVTFRTISQSVAGTHTATVSTPSDRASTTVEVVDREFVCGQSTGDPHLGTFGGTSYDFMDAGDYQLVRAAGGNGPDTFVFAGDIIVQVRQFPVSDSVSANNATATVIGNETLIIGDSRKVSATGPPGIRVSFAGDPLRIEDGERRTLADGQGLIVRRGNSYTVYFAGPDGEATTSDEHMTVDVFNNRIDVEVCLLADREGEVEGLLGNLDGGPGDDIAFANGTALDEPLRGEVLYGEFSRSWQVTGEENLFAREYTVDDFPRKVVTVEDLSEEERERAEEVLAGTCLEPGTAAYRDALLDVALTGDSSYVDSACKSDEPARESNVTGDVESPGGVTLSLRPTNASVGVNGTRTLNVVLEGINNGVSAYDIELAVGDTSTATITAVADATGGSATTDVAPDGSSASVSTVGAGLSGSGPVTLATVTVEGTAVGTTDLNLTSQGIGDAANDPYSLAAVRDATLQVREEVGPPPVCPGGSAPTDPDDDGTYEDANGDGTFDIFDVQCLLDNFDSAAVQNNPSAFDFTGDDKVDIFDVQMALNEV